MKNDNYIPRDDIDMMLENIKIDYENVTMLFKDAEDFKKQLQILNPKLLA